MKTELLFKAESYQIIGACFEVYREKGCGFLEPVYQECMEIELRLQGIPFVAQKPLPLEYKGTPLRTKYEPDFVCYDKSRRRTQSCEGVGRRTSGTVTKLFESNQAQTGLAAELWSLPEDRNGTDREHSRTVRVTARRLIVKPRNTRNTRKEEFGSPLFAYSAVSRLAMTARPSISSTARRPSKAWRHSRSSEENSE